MHTYLHTALLNTKFTLLHYLQKYVQHHTINKNLSLLVEPCIAVSSLNKVKHVAALLH